MRFKWIWKLTVGRVCAPSSPDAVEVSYDWGRQHFFVFTRAKDEIDTTLMLLVLTA